MNIFVWIPITIISFVIVGYFFVPSQAVTEFSREDFETERIQNKKEIDSDTEIPSAPIKEETIHVQTPLNVIGVYFTNWAAGTKSYQQKLDEIIDKTSVNTVVIDIKDYTGKLAFKTENVLLNKVGSPEERIRNIKDYFKYLHQKEIYIVGRLSVFQDIHYVNKYPESAVKTLSGEIWRDRKKIPWVEAGAEEYWNYILEIAKEAYEIGFDEINFDYIRFPSDGNMKDISYKFTNGRSRREVMKSFYQFLYKNMTDLKIPYSADLFGLVTTSGDDLGIGQYLEDALPYFDYIMPMVYPSHFADGWYGIPKPGKEPGKVVLLSMKKAIERTLSLGLPKEKLRPWIQDFDIGATYDEKLVKDQIQSSLNLGLESFIVWDPSIKYQLGALKMDDYKIEPVEIILPIKAQDENT